jgi:hypothetical protein
MPSFDAPILRLARHVADIKRGGKSIEEKAEAIGSFVTSFFLGTETVLRSEASYTVLPPLSRVRASLEVPRVFAKPHRVCAPEVPQRIIRIKPPIIVKQLATKLGLTPHQIISELMNFNIFANINQTIEPDIASKIAESHGFKREIDSEGRILESRAVTPHKEVATVTSLEEIMHKLHTDTILFLYTADTLAAALREYDLGWSPAVIMLCKAFEKETNGRYLWPRIADMFDMSAADPVPTPLTVYMADKKEIWEAMVRKDGLQPVPYEQVASWPFADAILRLMEFDNITSTIKARQAGFNDCVHTEDMFARFFAQLRTEKIIP